MSDRVNLLNLTPADAETQPGGRDGRARRARLSRRSASAPTLGSPGLELRGDHGDPGRAAAHARRALRSAAADAHHAAGVDGRHAQIPLPSRRRRSDRDGRDPRREPDDALHLVAGGVCAALRLLRDRCDGLLAQPRAVRDLRSGARDAPARRAGRGDEHRLHGHGRAAHELEGGVADADRAQRSAGARASVRGTSPSPRSACCRASSRSASVRSSSVSRSPSMRRRTSCASSSCRSTRSIRCAT